MSSWRLPRCDGEDPDDPVSRTGRRSLGSFVWCCGPLLSGFTRVASARPALGGTARRPSEACRTIRAVNGTPIELRATGLDDLLAGAARIEAFAARHSLSIPPVSRLRQYIAVLRGLKSGVSAHVGTPDVGGAVLELRQLVAIIDGLGEVPSLPTTFKRLLDGHYLTLDAPTSDPARDAQFELFVASRLALGGLRTRLAEPDVVVDLCGEPIGIAAKRPRTPGGLKSAIRKGRHQVRNQGVRGFLALDASMYPIPDGQLIAAFLDRTDDAPRAAREQLVAIVARSQHLLTPRLMEEPEYSGTLGLLFHLAVPFVVETDAGFTAVVGEAWLALPSKYRLFPALARLVGSLGPAARILAAAPPHHSSAPPA